MLREFVGVFMVVEGWQVLVHANAGNGAVMPMSAFIHTVLKRQHKTTQVARGTASFIVNTYKCVGSGQMALGICALFDQSILIVFSVQFPIRSQTESCDGTTARGSPNVYGYLNTCLTCVYSEQSRPREYRVTSGLLFVLLLPPTIELSTS